MYKFIRVALVPLIIFCLASMANADENDDAKSIRLIVSSVTYRLQNENYSQTELRELGEQLSNVGVVVTRLQHKVARYNNEQLNSDLQQIRMVVSSCSYRLREETPQTKEDQQKLGEFLGSIGTHTIRIQNIINRLSK